MIIEIFKNASLKRMDKLRLKRKIIYTGWKRWENLKPRFLHETQITVPEIFTVQILYYCIIIIKFQKAL